MLKFFTVFQPLHESQHPLCYALLCIGKDPSKPIAYAWVDTINTPGEITYQRIDHDNQIEPRKVLDALNAVCGTDLDNVEDLLDALYDHMVEKAFEKLETRQKWYDTQGRRYQTSHYATLDAAWASHPTFKAAQLKDQLQAERLEIKFRKKVDLLDTVTGRKGKWTWDEHYQEMPNLQSLIEALAKESPSHIDHAFAKARLEKHFKPARCNTAKLRLQHLIEQVNKLPKYSFRHYEMIYARGKADHPWHTLVPHWFTNNPPPLKNADYRSIAKMDYDEMCELMAEQMTWLSRWHKIEARIVNFKKQSVFRYTWDRAAQEMQTEPMTVDVNKELGI